MVAIADGTGYEAVEPKSQTVNVQAVANTADPGPRISVAEVAVNSILDFLNVNSGSSPSTTGKLSIRSK